MDPPSRHRGCAASARARFNENAVRLYDRLILPRLIDLAMRQERLLEYREELVPQARGRVLEIGIGSGLNLALYGAAVECVIGIDPSRPLLAKARRRAAGARPPITLVEGTAQALPLALESIDAVVLTWTLCSIAEPLRALAEIRRVMKPGAELFFVEHGLSPQPSLAHWQHRLTPLWRRLAGGCHLDRRADALLREAGFEITELQNFYARGPRLFTYFYEGRAIRPNA
jgi:ubiquinone/menaquinone biosynthesis C-methylase UbiE